MARFILDIGNLDRANIQEAMINVIDLLGEGVATIECIDNTNHGQFHGDERRNYLTTKQIENFEKHNLDI